MIGIWPYVNPLTLTAAASSPPDANTLYTNNIPKAWARVANTGSPSLADSFNVSGIVDDGAGMTTITLDRDMANDDYAVLATFGQDPNASGGIGVSAFATTGFQVITRNSADAATDYAFSAAVYGDQ